MLSALSGMTVRRRGRPRPSSPGRRRSSGRSRTGAAFGLLAGLVLTPTIRVDDLPRPLPGDAAPVGAPVR